MPLIFILLLFALTGSCLGSDGAMPVGLASEPVFISRLVQIIFGGLAVFLLAGGRRYPIAVVTIFLLLSGGAISNILLAHRAYSLALAGSAVILALGLALYIYLPRLFMAIAVAWVPAALYIFYLLSAGEMNFGPPWIIGLLLAGAIVGALRPRWAVSLLSIAMAVVLFVQLNSALQDAVGSQWYLWIMMAIAAAGLLWQWVVDPRRKPLIAADIAIPPKETFFRAIKTGVAALLAFAGLIALFAPQLSSPENFPDRWQALKESGAQEMIGLSLSAENNHYLFGKAYPVAIIAPESSFLNRLLVFIYGKNPRRDIHRIRAVKDETELRPMRRAAAITSEAFATIAPMIRPGVNEADIEAAIMAVFRKNGAERLAFGCIVGSGANAVLPHYSANNSLMEKGLVVIDIGCMIDNYASDMTRTFPVKGILSEPERELMEVVKAAADSARAHLRSGAKFSDLHQRADKVIRDSGFEGYFIHSLGHHVGINVHDPHIDSLTTGMGITIEPGIYIPHGSDIDPKYWDLGVRIEDTYIVTDEGYEEITHFPYIHEQAAANAIEDSLLTRKQATIENE